MYLFSVLFCTHVSVRVYQVLSTVWVNPIASCHGRERGRCDIVPDLIHARHRRGLCQLSNGYVIPMEDSASSSSQVQIDVLAQRGRQLDQAT